jgi:Leucine-rich repeat (LRR) protein
MMPINPFLRTDYSYYHSKISTSQRHDISVTFKEWVNDISADPDEKRIEAVERIRSFLDNPNASMLDLSRLNLTRLPFKLFKVRDFKSLQTLDLSYNRFTAVPEGLEDMPGLRTIYLSNNPIRENEIKKFNRWPHSVSIFLSANPVSKL